MVTPAMSVPNSSASKTARSTTNASRSSAESARSDTSGMSAAAAHFASGCTKKSAGASRRRSSVAPSNATQIIEKRFSQADSVDNMAENEGLGDELEDAEHLQNSQSSRARNRGSKYNRPYYGGLTGKMEAMVFIEKMRKYRQLRELNWKQLLISEMEIMLEDRALTWYKIVL